MDLSIIIPVYNLKKYIAKCLLSCIYQHVNTLKVEIIVVDDGSIDGSIEVIKEFQEKFNFIKLLSKKNGGASSARNLGVNHASGEYIWFVDGDDNINPESFRIIESHFAGNNGIDLLFINYNYVDEKGNVLKTSFIPISQILNPCSGKEFFVKRTSDFVMPWRYIIRKNFVVDNNLFFIEGITFEDDEWAPRLLFYAKKIQFIDEVIYYYLAREGSLMSSFTPSKIPSFLRVIRETKKMRDEVIDDESYKHLLSEYIQQYIANYLFYRSERGVKGNSDILEIKRIGVLKSYPNMTLKKKIQLQMIKHSPLFYSRLIGFSKMLS